MTADEINALKAGPDLNAAVVRALGWVRELAPGWWALDSPDGTIYGRGTTEAAALATCPNLSGDIAAAMRLWFWMLERVGECNIRGDMEDYGREPGPIVWVTIGGAVVFGPLPLAVCQATLLSLLFDLPPTPNPDSDMELPF